MARQIQVDVVTDIICPWCLVGGARLDRAIAALPEDVEVTVRHHPFYLDPTLPEEGVVVADMLRQRYGREPEEMWERVESAARDSGVSLDLSKQPKAYPTRKGHTLVRLAGEKGTAHGLSNALTEAYFLKHQQVHDSAVLAEIAAPFGFTREEAIAAVESERELAITLAQAEAMARQGIRGVPFYVFNGLFALSGAQPEDVFAQAFAAALDPEKHGIKA